MCVRVCSLALYCTASSQRRRSSSLRRCSARASDDRTARRLVSVDWKKRVCSVPHLRVNKLTVSFLLTLGTFLIPFTAPSSVRRYSRLPFEASLRRTLPKRIFANLANFLKRQTFLKKKLLSKLVNVKTCCSPAGRRRKTKF